MFAVIFAAIIRTLTYFIHTVGQMNSLSLTFTFLKHVELWRACLCVYVQVYVFVCLCVCTHMCGRVRECVNSHNKYFF